MDLHNVKNGEVVAYDLNQWYWVVCCDCMLTHYEKYDIKGKKMIMRIYRDDWETDNNRQKMPDKDLNDIISALLRERRRRKK